MVSWKSLYVNFLNNVQKNIHGDVTELIEGTTKKPSGMLEKPLSLKSSKEVSQILGSVTLHWSLQIRMNSKWMKLEYNPSVVKMFLQAQEQWMSLIVN